MHFHQRMPFMVDSINLLVCFAGTFFKKVRNEGEYYFTSTTKYLLVLQKIWGLVMRSTYWSLASLASV